MGKDTLPVTKKTKLSLAKKRGAYDTKTIYAIIDQQPLCHIAWMRDGQPFCTPTFQWREGNHVYWHGSVASGFLQASKQNPVCMTITSLDGFVLAKSAFHHSANYRSVMLFGTPELVEEPEEKIAKCRRFIDHLFPARWEQLREMTKKENNATTLLTLPITEASAKIRTGPPVEDKNDLNIPVWSGVVPITTQLEQPEADANTPTDMLPPNTLINPALFTNK